MDSYSTAGAAEIVARGKRMKFSSGITNGVWAFIRCYFLRLVTAYNRELLSFLAFAKKLLVNIWETSATAMRSASARRTVSTMSLLTQPNRRISRQCNDGRTAIPIAAGRQRTI